jgi:copper chaperone NosL
MLLTGRTFRVVAPLLLLALGAWRGPEPSRKDGQKAGPQPALTPMDAAGHLVLDSADRCPVCAMPVAEHAKHASGLQLGDGTTFVFCGNGCGLKAWLHPEVFLGRDPADRKRLVVRDYLTGEPLDAQAATFVAGSDVVGPMGRALVALGDAEALAAFRARHGGSAVFRVDELTDARWLELTGRPILP